MSGSSASMPSSKTDPQPSFDPPNKEPFLKDDGFFERKAQRRKAAQIAESGSGGHASKAGGSQPEGSKRKSVGVQRV